MSLDPLLLSRIQFAFVAPVAGGLCKPDLVRAQT
jgi:hypothetical protein